MELPLSVLTLGLLKKRNKDIEKAALFVIAKSPESLIFFFFSPRKEKNIVKCLVTTG